MNIRMHYKYMFLMRSQIKKYGQDVIIQNGQMYNIQNGKFVQDMFSR